MVNKYGEKAKTESVHFKLFPSFAIKKHHQKDSFPQKTPSQSLFIFPSIFYNLYRAPQATQYGMIFYTDYIVFSKTYCGDCNETKGTKNR